MSVIQLDVQEGLAELLGSSPEHIERSALETIVLELYRSRELSAELAAKFLNTEKFAFIGWAGERGVPYFDMTPEAWQLELQAIRKKRVSASLSLTQARFSSSIRLAGERDSCLPGTARLLSRQSALA